MATSSNHPYRPSSHASTPDRPATIAELAALAQKEVWDPSLPLKHWLRTAERARKAGQAYVEAQNYEAAFIEFAKAATIVLERLPTHHDYHALLNTEQRHNLGMNGQDMLDHLSQLKKILVERYEKWRIRRESDRASSSQHTDGLARDDVARRRREEHPRSDEEERAWQAREATRREEEWRRQDLARREAEELERRREEDSRRARSSEARSRDPSEARRAAEAREAADFERQAQTARLRREDDVRRPHSDEEREYLLRKRVEERTRQEQEGILRRQREADLAARTARLEITSTPPSVTVRHAEQDYNRLSQGSESSSRNAQVVMPAPAVAPQPPRPTSASQTPTNAHRQGPPKLPLESPSKLDDDTDDDDRSHTQHRSWNQEDTPSRSRDVNLRITYPAPITTTSPVPPDAGPIRYPTLMSQHQLKQGYVPSLQSMFAQPSIEPPSSSSLLLDTQAPGSLYSGILPKPSTTPPTPVIPPPPPGMPAVEVATYPAYESRYLTGYRGAPTVGQRLPHLLAPAQDRPHKLIKPSRIVKGASKDADVRELKSVRLPRECLQRFVSIARVNTAQNRETCGLLLGRDKGNKFVITTLLIPKQHSTSDTCTMDEEELVMQFTEERNLITLGWIHTHPTQSCFMSSVDLHTHSGFQQMLPESFAVVCAPNSKPSFGIFRLTDPGGLQTILECNAKEAFHPHPDVPIYTHAVNNRRRKDIYTIPRQDQELLGRLGYKNKISEVDKAIAANAEFLRKIIADPQIFEQGEIDDTGYSTDNETEFETDDPFIHEHSHDPGHSHAHTHVHGERGHTHSRPTLPAHQARKPTESDIEKLRSTIKQFVRDWSEEGKAERDLCYGPIKEALLKHFESVSEDERQKLRVLVPGAGLCRLAWDVANLGFACQGNEFSHYMLLSSYFILNRTSQADEHTIYPYIHSFSNVWDRLAMLRAVKIPDVLLSLIEPSHIMIETENAGDFEDIYGVEGDPDEPQSGLWDAILTCFFIDTAKNIVNYLRIIHRKLAPGGVWINLGPLLWHWENNTTGDPSVELDLDEVKALARMIGFKISNEKTIDMTYTNNFQSMLGYTYHTAFWTATKVA
ncbi:hypothetical protein NM688_g4515 [Phlebia brevispora]|uniref:Uncharacterized protein n=1 Tax=Phlebia brevispora TaxID=194682 RepID=A0ACC1T2Q4_9APHY|nr:hypothetical protein NM688_g4515 [Phlebia brevispora]